MSLLSPVRLWVSGVVPPSSRSGPLWVRPAVLLEAGLSLPLGRDGLAIREGTWTVLHEVSRLLAGWPRETQVPTPPPPPPPKKKQNCVRPLNYRFCSIPLDRASPEASPDARAGGMHPAFQQQQMRSHSAMGRAGRLENRSRVHQPPTTPCEMSDMAQQIIVPRETQLFVQGHRMF